MGGRVGRRRGARSADRPGGLGPRRARGTSGGPSAVAGARHHRVGRGPRGHAPGRRGAGAGQPVGSRWRGGPRRERRPARARHLPGARRRRHLRSRRRSRARRGAGPGDRGRADDRARIAAGCRRPRRLHLGHHRQAQGRRAHSRVPAGGHLVAARSLGVGSCGPAGAQPAAVPRPRALRRPLRDLGRRRVGCRVRPLRRVRRPRGGTGQHHVLRRPDDVSPTRRIGPGAPAGRVARLRLGLGASRRRTVEPPGGGGRTGARALRHDRDAADAVQPARR